MSERDPHVQRAAATFRWTGSWYTVFVTADRLGGAPVDDPFEAELLDHLEPYRMAGYDLEVDGPRFVPLDVGLHVCVKPEYFRSDVKAAVFEVLSSGARPDGTLGFFHPDRFTFGSSVYLSAIVAAAQAVEGVESVTPATFQRQRDSASSAIDTGVLEMGRLEIARLDDDPIVPRARRARAHGGRRQVSAATSTCSCGCCAGVTERTPLEVQNRPGLSAISYRVATYSDFRASMIAALTAADRPRLAALGTRDSDDFTIALLDAWAVTSDVLTFYNERLAQESYLRTAHERISLQELGRLIGYRLRPGVAAETSLAFALEPPPDVPPNVTRDPGSAPPVTPASVTLEAGLRVQSIPGPGRAAADVRDRRGDRGEAGVERDARVDDGHVHVRA